jgi:hypothetical protein
MIAHQSAQSTAVFWQQTGCNIAWQYIGTHIYMNKNVSWWLQARVNHERTATINEVVGNGACSSEVLGSYFGADTTVCDFHPSSYDRVEQYMPCKI